MEGIREGLYNFTKFSKSQITRSADACAEFIEASVCDLYRAKAD